MSGELVRALDLCLEQDWDAAKGALAGLSDPAADRLAILITELQTSRRGRANEMSQARHEIGNRLSIAQANLEAMLDGVVENTPERLRAVLDSLRTAGEHLMALAADRAD